MAAGRLPAPGTTYGPCEGECHHTDCARTRQDAAEVCPECGQPIGYETLFYQHNGALFHALCLEGLYERERANEA